MVPGQHHHSLEATAYAVLALVKAKEYVKAGEAVNWLARQQSHYGGSGTTQVTNNLLNNISTILTLQPPQCFKMEWVE
ncbi:MAG: hypothetical protein ACRC7H_06700 [Plesiomonas shigelloides]